MLLTNNNIFVYSKVLLYISILEEVTSVNISMCRATRIQDLAGLTTPALLPQLPRAGGPPVFMAQLLTPFLYCLCSKRRKHSSDTPALILFTSYWPIALQSFYLIFIISFTSWRHLVNHRVLDTLPMIRIYAMFAAGDFLPRKNMTRTGYSTRSCCYQRLVMWI